MEKTLCQKFNTFPFGESVMKCFAVTDRKKKNEWNKRHYKKYDNPELRDQVGKILQSPSRHIAHPQSFRIY